MQKNGSFEDEAGTRVKERVGKDTFTTLEEAQKRAEEIGCNGTHTHTDDDGNMVYMPCATHNEYEQRLNGNES